MYAIPTQPSAFSRNEGDPKKGGTGFRVKRPQPDNWREYGFEFTVVHPLDRLYFYIEHQLRLNGQWKSVYCLGTPPDLTNGRVQPEPLGLEQCRQILVPGYDCPLHDCMEEMPEGEARTRVQYRFLVINWSSGAMQMMDVPEMALTKMFETLQEDAAASEGKVDTLKFTWAWKCEPSGAMWKNVIEPVYHARWRSREDIQEMWQREAVQKRWQKLNEFFSRAQTPDQIREALGAAKVGPTAAPSFLATPPAPSGDSEGDFFAGAAPTAPAPVGPVGGTPPAFGSGPDESLAFLNTEAAPVGAGNGTGFPPAAL